MFKEVNCHVITFQCANLDQVGHKAEAGGGTVNEGGYGQNDARRLKKKKSSFLCPIMSETGENGKC